MSGKYRTIVADPPWDYSGPQALSPLDRRPTGDVDLLVDADDLDSLHGHQAPALLSRRDERLALAPGGLGDPDESDCPPHPAGTLLHEARVVSPTSRDDSNAGGAA